ncbi:ALG9 [Lepeophtheirus salmonis]|uniref:Mannosyltransferase n=1 Tax=Lepeophtheirus salmonis TaxID=72036 RepID=A0A7R8H4W2_LEPSM|nr:ALG9 [Lepeophtheirus salmonis]CAF2852289.1 ALG9 [Lepeophtheirus salmonis]
MIHFIHKSIVAQNSNKECRNNSEEITLLVLIYNSRICRAQNYRDTKYISDCDETYNYWEPAHYLIYGKGFQTWEYSPVYCLRSYSYILLHTLPGAFLHSSALPVNYGAWFHSNIPLAISCTALSTLFSWPFAGALGVPIALDILFRQKRLKEFITYSLSSFFFIFAPEIMIDWVFYGKIVFAPLNIVIYNIFTSHGADIYGTEPWYFYLLNGFLNFNFIFFISLLVIPMGLFTKLFTSTSNNDIPFCTLYIGFYLWLGIFTFQSHKEERFLFPIYPLICLGASHFIDCLQKLYTCLARNCSRIMSLYVNYNAPTSLWVKINSLPDNLNTENNPNHPPPKYTVCVGKEWYRFPTSFFLPSTSWNVEFLKSDFKGQLPRHYDESDYLTTSRIIKEFNDQNLEEKSRYRIAAEDCDFIVDQDTGDDSSNREENYIRNKKRWKVVFSYGILNPKKMKSNRFLRAFYVPFLSSKKDAFNEYTLLRNEVRFQERKLKTILDTRVNIDYNSTLMDSKATVRVGQRVCLKDKKDVEGVVSFFGFPDFAPGKWVGLTLDTPKGKNNGTVQGRSYFTCPENYGMFVRQTNIMILGPSENTSPSSMSSSVTLKSRLPVLGATKSGSVGSRSPSFTDLKGKKTPKPSVVNTSRIEREPSFIEPNFVQTMKPPSTSESPSMNSPRSDRLEEKVAALQTQQNLQVAREEVKDLNEKLETLKIKRVKDQEKIKELDKMKIQHETLTEFKSRIMESQKDLQRKLVEAERIAREAV